MLAGVKFRFDARGRASPAGHTVRYPPAMGSVTVTLRTTADTPVAGTPPRPVTWRSMGRRGGHPGRRGAVAGPGVEDPGRRQGVEAGAVRQPTGPVPAGHVGDQVARPCPVVQADLPFRAHLDRHQVGHRLALAHVQVRGQGSGLTGRPDGQVASGPGFGDGDVEDHGGGARGRHPAAADHRDVERGPARDQRRRRPVAGPGVEDPGGGQRMEPSAVARDDRRASAPTSARGRTRSWPPPRR